MPRVLNHEIMFEFQWFLGDPEDNGIIFLINPGDHTLHIVCIDIYQVHQNGYLFYILHSVYVFHSILERYTVGTF